MEMNGQHVASCIASLPNVSSHPIINHSITFIDLTTGTLANIIVILE